MTTEEADILLQISIEQGDLLPLVRMTKRCRAVAQRMEVNTNYVRIIGDVAFLTEPGRAALEKHQSVHAQRKGRTR